MPSRQRVKHQHTRGPRTAEDLIITSNPKSAFAEAIKSVKTNIRFSTINQDLKTILITSPTSGDGKSFISANLAAAFADDDKKVLLIDADLRRGRQSDIFNLRARGVAPNSGYSSLIIHCKRSGIDQLHFDHQIHKTQYANISLLPAGYNPPNPLELLASEQNAQIIQRLKELYDIIIIDCPPVLGLSDALVMSKYSDVNLIVITNGKTKYEQIKDSKNTFAKVNSKVTGVIVNRTKPSKNSYYYSSYYTED